MASYDLPTSTELAGSEYAIRSDWRAAMDVITVMSDLDIEDEERAVTALSVFYEDFDLMPTSCFQDALEYMYWFIGGGGDDANGRTPKTPKAKLMDWEQDLPILISPINRVLGFEVRAVEYLHWWTFLAAYYEIGSDCLFAQIVGIRKKRSQGKKLDKSDMAFYQENRDLIDFKKKLSSHEEDLLEKWL